MKYENEIIVVCAGPAVAITAKMLARYGHEVLMLDK